MIIKQLSVFIENKEGRILSAADVLAKNNVNIRALSLADTAEFGILRLIVDKPEEGKAFLAYSGVIVRITDVVAVTMSDAPGGMLGALKILSDNNINIEYMYACVGHKSGKAIMIMQLSDIELAEKKLSEGGFGMADKEDLLF